MAMNPEACFSAIKDKALLYLLNFLKVDRTPFPKRVNHVEKFTDVYP
jgi:hypothetical protein